MTSTTPTDATPDATSPADIMRCLATAPDDRLAKLAERIITHADRLPLATRHLCCAADQIVIARALRRIASAAAERGDSLVFRLACGAATGMEAEALDHVTAATAH